MTKLSDKKKAGAKGAAKKSPSGTKVEPAVRALAATLKDVGAQVADAAEEHDEPTDEVGPVASETSAVSLEDAVLAVFTRDEPRLVWEEITGRLTVPWTPDTLSEAMRSLESRGVVDRVDGDEPVYVRMWLGAAEPTSALADSDVPLEGDEEEIHQAALAHVAKALEDDERTRQTRHLVCVLTPEDRAAKRERAEELRAEEVQALAEVARLAGELKAAQKRAESLGNLKDREHDVSLSGEQRRDVECIEAPLWKLGVAVTIRLDTLEEIERRPLVSAAERQGSLLS